MKSGKRDRITELQRDKKFFNERLKKIREHLLGRDNTDRERRNLNRQYNQIKATISEITDNIRIEREQSLERPNTAHIMIPRTPPGQNQEKENNQNTPTLNPIFRNSRR